MSAAATPVTASASCGGMERHCSASRSNAGRHSTPPTSNVPDSDSPASFAA
jgi:hypothetical protein